MPEGLTQFPRGLTLRSDRSYLRAVVEASAAPECKAVAEDRIQANRLSTGGAKVVQARRHIGQRRRIRGVANQNDGLRPAAPIFRRGFVRERCGRSRASRFDFICRSLEGAAGAWGVSPPERSGAKKKPRAAAILLRRLLCQGDIVS